jgi:hypothetical protein
MLFTQGFKEILCDSKQKSADVVAEHAKSDVVAELAKSVVSILDDELPTSRMSEHEDEGLDDIETRSSKYTIEELDVELDAIHSHVVRVKELARSAQLNRLAGIFKSP